MTNLTPTQKAIHDLRAEFNKTDIQKIFEYIEKLESRITDLEKKAENYENEKKTIILAEIEHQKFMYDMFYRGGEN